MVPTAWCRRSLGIGLEGEPLGHPLHLYSRAPGLLEKCGRKPTVFFLTIDRGGLWSTVRVIDPANATWRLMVLDTDGTLTPETVDRDGYLRRAVGRETRGRVARHQHLDPAQRQFPSVTDRAASCWQATRSISCPRPARSA